MSVSPVLYGRLLSFLSLVVVPPLLRVGVLLLLCVDGVMPSFGGGMPPWLLKTLVRRVLGHINLDQESRFHGVTRSGQCLGVGCVVVVVSFRLFGCFVPLDVFCDLLDVGC